MMKEDKGLGRQTHAEAQCADLQVGRSTTADVSVLRDLLARVEAATGPDPALSVAIWYELHEARERLWALSGMNAQRGPRQNTDRTLKRCVTAAPKDYGWWESEHHFTASLDAALGLVERVLPDKSLLLGLRQTAETLPWARIGRWHAADATGATPALALLAAMLSALIATAPDQPACEASGAAKVVGKVPGRD